MTGESDAVSVDEMEPLRSDDEPDQYERRWSKKAASKPAPPPELDDSGVSDAVKEKKRADELFERLQRSMADLSNYRKRVEAEREEMAKLASMLLVAELLPVLDNFERALDSIPRELQSFSWLQGVALIERHLQAILEKQGVEPIEALGKAFNPNLHEAIVEEETSETTPGTVIGEMQKGYTMHGHVLRATLANVAKAMSAPPPGAQSDASAPAAEANGGRVEPDASATGA